MIKEFLHVIIQIYKIEDSARLEEITHAINLNLNHSDVVKVHCLLLILLDKQNYIRISIFIILIINYYKFIKNDSVLLPNYLSRISRIHRQR